MSGRRQFGAIRRLGSGRYQASYWQNGRRYVAPMTFMTKAMAGAYLDGVNTELHRGTWIDPVAARVTLTEYANNWLATRPALRPRSVEMYQRLLDKEILPTLGSTMIADLAPATVRSWNAALASAHASTAAKAYRLLSTIMKTAVEDDLIVRSPVA